MLPRDNNLQNLALYAPRQALAMLLGVPRVPFVGNIQLQFTTSSTDAAPVVEALDQNLTQDTVIERVSFSLFQEDSFAGNVFQAQYFANLKQSTGVSVSVAVFGGPKYDVNTQPTPLENFADMFAVTWPQGWPLAKQSNVRVTGYLTQTPVSVPYDVNIALLGWQFLDKSIDNLSDDDARKALGKLGFPTVDLSLLLPQATT